MSLVMKTMTGQDQWERGDPGRRARGVSAVFASSPKRGRGGSFGKFTVI